MRLVIFLTLTFVSVLKCKSSVLMGKRSGGQASPSSPVSEDTEEALKKTNNNNDDSHLRLYYKANSPGRTVSHELEHRLIKNPAYQQYNHHRLVQENNNMNTGLFVNSQYMPLPNQYPPNAYDPRLYVFNQQQQQFRPTYQQQQVFPNSWSNLDRARLMLNANNYPRPLDYSGRKIIR